MRTLIVLAAAATLAGCTTLSTVDQKIRQNLPLACSVISQVHVAFHTIHAVKPFSQRVATREAQAWAAVETFCADPANFTLADAPIKIANAYAEMLKVKAEIEAVQ